jgi:hypothetical protein
MRTFLTLLLLLCFAPRALAWGREGHQIVADLAERQLSPAASAEVRRLLALEPASSLADIAAWAEDRRESDPAFAKKTARWHFVNFPRGDCSYAPARDCPDGQCVVAAINRQFLVLADTGNPDAERLEALKFLVHFVGDVHQPLHAAFGDDRGGNDFQVRLDGKGSNLHQVWDVKIIEAHEPDFHAYADALAKQGPLPFDASGRFDRPAVDWALESCRIASQEGFYPSNHDIGPTYFDQHRALLEQQLLLAGKRLADMINYALPETPAAQH